MKIPFCTNSAKKMDSKGHPKYLDNTPSVICDQVMWLVKNSGLNFSFYETPFSLDIKLKKRFVQKWTTSEENHVDEKNAFEDPQTSATVAFDNFIVVDNERKTAVQKAEALEDDLNLCNAKLLDSLKETNVIKSDRKSLETKHMKVCDDIKVLKQEKDAIESDKKAMSVSMKSLKKANKEQALGFEKEALKLRKAVEEVSMLKEKVKDEARLEKKERKKLSKKLKQDALKELQKQSNRGNNIPETVKKEKEEPPEHNLEGKETEIVLFSSKNRFECHSNSSDSEGKNETADLKNNFDETSEAKSDSDISNLFIYSSPAPLTVSDLEDWLKRYTDRYKT